MVMLSRLSAQIISINDGPHHTQNLTWHSHQKGLIYPILIKQININQ